MSTKDVAVDEVGHWGTSPRWPGGTIAGTVTQGTDESPEPLKPTHKPAPRDATGRLITRRDKWDRPFGDDR